MKKTVTTYDIAAIKSEIALAFGDLNFDEETHSYTWNGKKLLSTTTYIERFSAEFDTYFASEAKGKKNLRSDIHDKRTGTYYRNRWKYQRDEAANAGNRVHSFADCYPNFDLPLCNKERGVIEFYAELDAKYVVLFTELRVYDKSTLRAGTMDGLLLNTETGNLVVIDWKTNSRNINECYQGKKLKDPFGDLYATSLSKFAIQLSDYANLINKNTKYKVEERWFMWLHTGDATKLDIDRSDSYKIIASKPDVTSANYKLYKVPDYSKNVETCLQKDKKALVSESGPAKPKKGLFTKKVTKKDSLSVALKKTNKL